MGTERNSDGWDRACTIALAACPSVEPTTLIRLVDRLGGAHAVWASSAEQWLAVCRLRPATVWALDRWRQGHDPATVEERLMHRDIRCVVRGDDDYPDALLELAQPPLVLFTKGRMHAFRRTVSIVGTRRMSAYGQEAARWIAETLAAGGIHIVSGLAEGIDAVAHRGALAVRGGTTAVLGCGVNLCYPSHHRRLYDEILASGGLIVSEYAPDVPVAKHRFPWRNRLIAALSPKLVLIQAGERSGALHTVDAALDLGRDVYVVPGPITASLHRGSNRLLQQGAQVLLDPTEFLADCGLDHAELSRSGIPERWRDLYDSMVEAKLPGQLARALGQPVGRVYEGLLELELAGMVARNPDGTYRRTGTATHGGRSVVDR